MDVQANTNYINYAIGEIYETLRQTRRLSAELEDVGKALCKYTEFRRHLQSLKKVRDDMVQEQYKISMLAQALMNIRNMYQDTETVIEDRLESKRHDLR